MTIITARNGHLRRKKSQRRSFKYSGNNHECRGLFFDRPEVTSLALYQVLLAKDLGMAIREYAKNTPTCSLHEKKLDHDWGSEKCDTATFMIDLTRHIQQERCQCMSLKIPATPTVPPKYGVPQPEAP